MLSEFQLRQMVASAKTIEMVLDNMRKQYKQDKPVTEAALSHAQVYAFQLADKLISVIVNAREDGVLDV